MDEWKILAVPSTIPQFSIAIVTIALVGFVVYYLLVVCKKPKIYCSNVTIKTFIDKHVKVVREKYYPAPLYFEGRLQTFIGVLQREIAPKLLPYVRDIIHLVDGGQLALDILEPNDYKAQEKESYCNGQSENQPPLVVLLLPGLTSHSQECYMKTLSLAITQAGAIAVALNNRGMGGVVIKTPRLFSASNCEDLAEVIDHLHKKFPLHRMMAIGVSMGGMQLSHFMIKYQEMAKARLTAAMLISIVWDTQDGLKNIEKGFLNKFIVNRAITGNLVYYAKLFRKDLDSRDCWDFDKILASKTISQFDDTFTGPQFGFANAEAYYSYSRVSGRTDKFPIPVFGLSAADDPLQPEKYLPIDEALAKGSNLALIVSEYGGHVGFLEGFLPIKKRINYLERIVIDIVQAVRIYGEDLVECS